MNKLTRFADSGAAEDDHPDPVDVGHPRSSGIIRPTLAHNNKSINKNHLSQQTQFKI